MTEHTMSESATKKSGMNERQATFLWTSVIWLCLVASCATTDSIKTWIIDKDGLHHNVGDVHDFKEFAEAMGYRCYSKEDDTEWRNRMNSLEACCNTHGAE